MQHIQAIAWLTFYANLCAMEKHPGNKDRNDKNREHPTYKTLARDADVMLAEFIQRFGETED